MSIKLYDWQEPYLKALEAVYEKRDSALLLSGTGSGKTYISSQWAKNCGGRLLVLAPKASLFTWNRVLEQFGVENYYCMNYEQLTSNSKLVKAKTVGKWQGKTFLWDVPPDTRIIFDEAHRCCGKDGKTKNSGLLIGAKKMGLKHLMMTATAPNEPQKWKAFGISLDLFKQPDYWQWALSHGVRKSYVHNGFDFPREDADYHLGKINQQLYEPTDNKPRAVCVPTSEILRFFPEGNTYLEPIELSSSKEAQIRKLYADDLDKLEALWTEAELIIVENLRVHQMIELQKVSVFLEETRDLRDQGFSVVIFVNYRATALKLQEELKTDSIIIGEQGMATRASVIDNFQANLRDVMVVTTSAGGEAISLHDLEGTHPRVSLLSPVWDHVKLKQVLGRIWRAGGLTPVTQRILVLPGIEEKIYTRVMEKLHDMSTISGDTFTVIDGEKQKRVIE